MSKLFIPLLAALALPTAVEANWFGKYNSRAEAIAACEKWRQKGENIYFLKSNNFIPHKLLDKPYSKLENWEKNYIISINPRDCNEEDETNQILGYELIGLKHDKIYRKEVLKGYPTIYSDVYSATTYYSLNSKVKKNFKY